MSGAGEGRSGVRGTGVGGAGGVAALAGGLALVGVGTAGMLADVEPFATWYYPFAWYGTLIAAEGALRVRGGGFHLLARPRFAATALAWSVPFWLTFELINFRVRNWYYVFVPDRPLARWIGITISFATVIPAVLLARRLLEVRGSFEDARTRPRTVPARLPAALQGLGVVMVLAALVWPRVLYPLIWGALTLLVDPWVYRRAPERSLLGHLETGRVALPLRLLAGGLAIGLLWELFNAGARGKWIYTVPGLEELKLFEMPLAGFLGFPVLALDAWAVWQALVVAGLAVDAPGRKEGDAAPPPGRSGGGAPAGRLALAALVAAAFSAAVLAAMPDRTITSYTPRLRDVAGPSAPALEAAGHDVFSLARAEPPSVADAAGVPEAVAASWIDLARLAVLRGIGTRHARALREVGVGSVEALAAADPAELADRLEDRRGVTPERVRVWVRGARKLAGRPAGAGGGGSAADGDPSAGAPPAGVVAPGRRTFRGTGRFEAPLIVGPQGPRRTGSTRPEHAEPPRRAREVVAAASPPTGAP